MNAFIKFGTIAVLIPILVAREVKQVLEATGTEIPDPDDILNELKEDLKNDSKSS